MMRLVTSTRSEALHGQTRTRAFVHRSEPEKFAEAVARHGYATDPHYAKKLKSVIHSHIAPLLRK
jgi:flagellum-specific peptidoglycan hydrolase FlgJ